MLSALKRGLWGMGGGSGTSFSCGAGRGLSLDAATPGSVQAGWGFTRAEADCGVGVDCAPGTGSFNSVHLVNRELGLYYYLISQMRVGINWYWWTSSNTPLTVQQAIGCTTRASNVGKDCDWHTLNLVLNANF